MLFALTGATKLNWYSESHFYIRPKEFIGKYFSFESLGFKHTISSMDSLCWIPDYEGPAVRNFKVIKKEPIPTPEIFDKFGNKFEIEKTVLYNGTFNNVASFYLGTIKKFFGKKGVRVEFVLDNGAKVERNFFNPPSDLLVIDEHFYSSVVMYKLAR